MVGDRDGEAVGHVGHQFEQGFAQLRLLAGEEFQHDLDPVTDADREHEAAAYAVFPRRRRPDEAGHNRHVLAGDRASLRADAPHQPLAGGEDRPLRTGDEGVRPPRLVGRGEVPRPHRHHSARGAHSTGVHAVLIHASIGMGDRPFGEAADDGEAIDDSGLRRRRVGAGARNRVQEGEHRAEVVRQHPVRRRVLFPPPTGPAEPSVDDRPDHETLMRALRACRSGRPEAGPGRQPLCRRNLASLSSIKPSVHPARLGNLVSILRKFSSKIRSDRRRCREFMAVPVRAEFGTYPRRVSSRLTSPSSIASPRFAPRQGRPPHRHRALDP